MQTQQFLYIRDSCWGQEAIQWGPLQSAYRTCYALWSDSPETGIRKYAETNLLVTTLSPVCLFCFIHVLTMLDHVRKRSVHTIFELVHPLYISTFVRPVASLMLTTLSWGSHMIRACLKNVNPFSSSCNSFRPPTDRFDPINISGLKFSATL